jgi:hypothetical protein
MGMCGSRGYYAENDNSPYLYCNYHKTPDMINIIGLQRKPKASANRRCLVLIQNVDGLSTKDLSKAAKMRLLKANKIKEYLSYKSPERKPRANSNQRLLESSTNYNSISTVFGVRTSMGSLPTEIEYIPFMEIYHEIQTGIFQAMDLRDATLTIPLYAYLREMN